MTWRVHCESCGRLVFCQLTYVRDVTGVLPPSALVICAQCRGDLDRRGLVIEQGDLVTGESA